MEGRTQYARSGDVNNAYQVVGGGPIDLVVTWGWLSHIEVFWDDPDIADLLARLAAFSRLIIFDKRGTGMSDRVTESELPTLEQRMDDVRAVMDAAGSRRAALLGISEGGAMSILFAATYPDRTSALVLIGSWATWLKEDSYPWVPTLEQHHQAMAMMRVQDPSEPFNLERFAPSKLHDAEFKRRFGGPAGGRSPSVGRRPRGAGGGNRGIPHWCPPRARDRSGARHRALQRHRRLDREGGGTRR